VNHSRYSRQIRVAGIGEAGQAALSKATVLLVGAGALGTHAADALVRAGVGRLWLVDRDIVEHSNLQRQVLYDEADAAAGTPKAVASVARLRAINRDVEIVGHVADCTHEFLRALPQLPDLLLDGTDNFPTRYLLNDFASRHRRPWIYAGAVGSEGAAMVVQPGLTPCLRCLWPEPPVGAEVGTCETVGILAPAIAAVTAFQVAEALKLLAGQHAAVSRGVFTCDVWRGSYGLWAGLQGPSPDCATCRGERFPALEAQPPEPVRLCGRDAMQIDPPRRVPLDLDRLQQRLHGAVTELVRTPHLLRFRTDDCRFAVFPGGRALLFGVHDPLRARTLYDRWIGAS
jgi:adenylyltransferase/sulfurtransferase